MPIRKQKYQNGSIQEYSSKARSSNVRGVGTFFDTCSNLGQLFPYNFKKLYTHHSENSMKTFKPFLYYTKLFKIVF